MENKNKQVVKHNTESVGVTETQMQMVGRIVLKLSQVKLPMDLMAIEDVIDTSLKLEREEVK